MSIRPIDMQVMVPKLQEVAQMKHIEQQKAGIHQQDIGTTQNKKNEREQKVVNKTNKDELLKNEGDAKEKGNNQYDSKGRKKGKPDKKGKELENNTKNRIDIKI